MHTDDHILETFLASNKPLAAIASDLSITLIALVHWMDKNVDLLAVAKRAMETHIAFLALKAEAAALVDLTNVSSTTTNEERKRKSASQLLRHSAKRMLTAVGASSSFSPQGGEKCLSAAKAMRGSSNAELSSTNPTRERGAPCASTSPACVLTSLDVAPRISSSLDASMPPASMPSSSSPPSPRPSAEKSLSTAGAKGMRGSPKIELSSTNPTRQLRAPCASTSPADLLNQLASSNIPSANAASSPLAASFSEHEIDVLMATLANHFNIDLATLADEPEKQPHAMTASP